MYLEHLNLVVKSIPEMVTFYQAAFPHWTIRGGAEQNWHGVERNWVHLGDDQLYLTLNDQGAGDIRDNTTNNVGLSHFAFVTNNLDNLLTRLHQAGFHPDKQGNPTQYRRNVYFVDPSGFEVEFVEYLSDVPAERNEYIYEN